MKTRIAKWGNGLAIRLPRKIAEAAKLTEGTAVELAARDNTVVIRRARRFYKLEDLLSGMTPEAMHEAFNWGSDVGREDIS